MDHISKLAILRIFGSTQRLLLIASGDMTFDEVYYPVGDEREYDPEADEDDLIYLLEEARNVWRSEIRRRWRARVVEPLSRKVANSDDKMDLERKASQ